MPEFSLLDDGDRIPSIPDEVIRAAQSGMLVVFVGAGASRQLGCLSWEEYARKKIDLALEEGLIIFEEAEYLRTLPPRTAITICKSMYKAKQIKPKSSAKEILHLTRKNSSILEHLYSWNAIYITTNYDEFLEEVARSNRPSAKVTAPTRSDRGANVDSDMPSPGKQDPILFDSVLEKKPPLILPNLSETAIADLKPGSIIHLHGCVSDEEAMIETIDEYVRHYTAPKVGDLLNWVFSHYVVVFVGYGLTELEILEYVVGPRDEGSRKSGCFVLWGCRDRKGNMAELQSLYFASMGVRSILYPIWKNGYSHLATVVSKWSEQLSVEARPKDYFHRIQLIEEVTSKDA